MTEQEAIEQLDFDKKMILFDPTRGEELELEQVKLRNEDNYKTYLADDMAIKALEKQIPYKPAPYQQYCGKCRCGAVFLDKHTKYCGNCGQALD